jgi:hypothetical protein
LEARYFLAKILSKFVLTLVNLLLELLKLAHDLLFKISESPLNFFDVDFFS